MNAGKKFDTGEKHYDNGTLVIEGTTYNSHGILTCKVSTNAGSDSASVQLVVKHAPPLINRVSESQIIHENDNLELTCDADGIPMPHISWRLPMTLNSGLETGKLRM